MKYNKTNFKLGTSIKRRRVYFKNRRKSRFQAFLLLLESAFNLLFFRIRRSLLFSFSFRRRSPLASICTPEVPAPDFSNVNVRRGSHNRRRRRSRIATQTNQEPLAPDFSKINLKRGQYRRRSPIATQTNQDLNTPVFGHLPSVAQQPSWPANPFQCSTPLKPSPLQSYAPILTSNGKFKCTFCDKEYASNGRWLHNHLRSCQNNPLNENISFIRNKEKFKTKNKNVGNFPKNLTKEFLKDFNLTPCDRNTAREKIADDSFVFMDTAFTGVATQAVTQEQNFFENQTTSFLSKHSRNLKIAALNINSIQNKFGDILFILNQQLADILVIGESKLDDTKDESLFQHPSYELFRRDRFGKGGGGLMVYVKRNLQPSRVFVDEVSEIISLIIITDKQKIGIIACYRPPYTQNETEFFASLDDQLKNLDYEAPAETLILGDLNYDMQDKLDSRKLIDFNTANGYTNTIKTSTRLNPSSGKETLLNVILSSSPTSCISSAVIPYSRSDHRLIISVFNFKSEKYKYCKIPSRCIDDKKHKLIKEEIKRQFTFYDFDSITEANLRWQAIQVLSFFVLTKLRQSNKSTFELLSPCHGMIKTSSTLAISETDYIIYGATLSHK